jgi:hypothetical protein
VASRNILVPIVAVEPHLLSVKMSTEATSNLGICMTLKT